jgi:hypothetical protein
VNLKQKLLAWMRGESSGDFSLLALEVFKHQFHHNTVYRNFCEAKGATPETVHHWREIPAVPTDVFKLPENNLRCFSREEVTGYFLTSGTTREVKGRHEYRDLDLYKASVLGAWRDLALPEMNRPCFFSQRVEHAQHSSLVRMFGFLDDEGQWLIDHHGEINIASFQPKQAMAIMGTSLALLKVCELTRPFQLPEGSWIFETGGGKGLRKNFTAEHVRQQLAQHFGVAEARILNEYSMTELFSQFYKWGDEQTHKGLPWVGIRVVDVFSGKPAKTGEPGYLEIIDLANLDSVSAIRTQDLAIAVGEREFILLGRDASATPRGCSRGSEHLLG